MGQSTASRLPAYETELKRLVDGAPVPRELYTRADAVPHAVALARMLDRTYRGSLHAKQSDYLTQLIRSGHFRHLSLALPRLNMEVLAAEEQEAKRSKQALRINPADSTITFGSPEHRHREITSMRDFMLVFVSAVIPSLIDRPAALLDWSLLARTALAIEDEKGWSASWTYVVNHLQRCVAHGTEVGCFDKRLWDDIRAELPPAPHSRAAAPAASAATVLSPSHSYPATSSVGRIAASAVKSGHCRDWNGISTGRTTCARQGCTYKHECCWADCRGVDPAHRGLDCAHNPLGSGNVAAAAAPVAQSKRSAAAGGHSLRRK